MRKLPAMTDMSISPKERQEKMSAMMEGHEGANYPHGLAICLTETELEKLDVDHEDWKVGDSFHLHCMATIKSISKGEDNCRVEMQIEKMTGESEDQENESEEEDNEDDDEDKKQFARSAARPPY